MDMDMPQLQELKDKFVGERDAIADKSGLTETERDAIADKLGITQDKFKDKIKENEKLIDEKLKVDADQSVFARGRCHH